MEEEDTFFPVEMKMGSSSTARRRNKVAKGP
jgi:hypothetical protein